MHEWLVRKLFPRPFFSGMRFENWVYRQFRRVFNRPFKVGSWADLLEPADARPWKWLHPGPLEVVSVEWVPARWNVAPGFLYRLRDRTGQENVFHEQYVIPALGSTVSKMMDGLLPALPEWEGRYKKIGQ